MRRDVAEPRNEGYLGGLPGHLVELPARSVTLSASGTGEETFVIMTGYAAVSPVLEFAPLVEHLDDDATVIVVEPFV